MSSTAEKAPEASRENILSPDAQQQREDMIKAGVIADPEASVPESAEVDAPSPWEMLGDMLAKLDPETRAAAVEHFSELGSPAVAGEVGVLEPTTDAVTADEPLAPVTPIVPIAKKRHTTFVSEADVEPATVATVPVAEVSIAATPTEASPAPVVEIRPSASTEAPVVQPAKTLEHRVATAKKLLETAPGGKVSYRERRLINKTSRDARTDERRRIKSGDSDMAEVKELNSKHVLQEQRTNELGVAEHNRTRFARRESLARKLSEKEDEARAAATVDGVFSDRAFRSRMKTYKNQLKKSINRDTKEAVSTAETNLTTAGTQLSTAEKARKNAIKSRRWYKNTRFSDANKKGRGVKSHASRPSPVRAMGSIEAEEERRRRMEAEARRAA